MSEIERIIANVDATMSMEGMPLTDIDKSRIRSCLEDRATFDDMVFELVNRYKRTI